jgi:hypothetical protein
MKGNKSRYIKIIFKKKSIKIFFFKITLRAILIEDASSE